MDTLKLILLILAIAAFLKAIWMLLWPAGVKATVDWWAKMPPPATRMVGVAAVVGGLVLIGLAIARMADAVIAAITMFGTICVVFGMFYQWPAVFAAMNKPFGSGGKDWAIRAAGSVLLLIALLLAYISLRQGA